MTTLTISRLSRHIFHEKALVNHCNAFVSLKNLSSSISSGDNNEGTNNILVNSKLQNSSRMSKTPKVKAGLPGKSHIFIEIFLLKVACPTEMLYWAASYVPILMRATH